MLNILPKEVETIEPQKKPMQKTYSVVSMFSGCGGMDLGFMGGFSFLGKKYAKNPYKIIWANDMNLAACRSYEKNLNHQIHVGDVWEAMESLPHPDEVDIVTGGFPCQDISVNGKGLGVNGARSGLYRAMVAAVRILKPKAFVAENVKGLLMKDNAESLGPVDKLIVQSV